MARVLLSAGVHVLLEKPMTTTRQEALELIALAETHGCVLQIGHLERFNPVIVALRDILDRVLFVGAIRTGSFSLRNTDVNVVLDLMIHDIDLLQHVIGRPVERVEVWGVPVFSRFHDIVNAQLYFEGGAIATVSASRVSFRTDRRMSFFQRDACILTDLRARSAVIVRKNDGWIRPGIPSITVERWHCPEADALRLEIEAFVAAVRGEVPVSVTGQDGLQALDVALLITERLRQSGLYPGFPG